MVLLPAILALAMPTTALAQTSSNGTSGYGTKAPPPTTKTEPKSGTAPSKEATTPTKTTPKESPAPSTSTEPTSTTPAQTSAAPAASKLPFTGLDLRVVIGAGLLLLASGFAIRIAQRRSAGH